MCTLKLLNINSILNTEIQSISRQQQQSQQQQQHKQSQ